MASIRTVMFWKRLCCSQLLSQTIPKRYYPICKMETNIAETKLPDDLTGDLSRVVQEMLNKPKELITVSLTTNAKLLKDESEAPMALLQIWSVGVFDQERNPVYTKALYDFLLPKLNIPAERIVILLHPIEKHFAAHLLYKDLQKEN